MENIVLFENQEVKIKTDTGVTMINLVHTARCLGLTQNKNGKQIVRWKSGDSSVVKKLNTIYSSGQSMPPQYMDEIKYILNEIDETDDRNSLYMSSWLSKRLAMECKSNKSMEYKNFLATLDENREQGLIVNGNSQELMTVVTNTMNAIMPNMVGEIVKQFAPVLQESKKQVNDMAVLIHDQAEIYDQERIELKSMIGLRSINVKMLTSKLKEVISEKVGYHINAKDYDYIKYKTKILNKFKVSKWEDIPVEETNNVYAYIDNLFEN